MDRDLLAKELKDLKEELEDIEEEKHFMLEKTYIHVPGSARSRYDEQIKALNEKIQAMEDKLNRKET